MKRKTSAGLLLVLIFILLLSSCSKNQKADVCLDAGHGGEDFGTVCGLMYEKDETLKFTLRLAHELTSRGIKVCLTREDDRFVSPQQRCKIANDSKAKLLVSFHRNTGEGSKGVVIWIHSENRRNDRILAENIMLGLKKVGITKDRGIHTGFEGDKNKNYFINSKTDMPSCMVELGYMSSKEDNALLNEKMDEYVAATADAVERTLKDTKN